MADSDIHNMTAASAAAVANEIIINEAGTSKRLSFEQLCTLIGACPRKCITGSPHSVTGTTGTEVTDLTITLPSTGTFRFKFALICQSDTATSGIGFGINCTAGVVTKMVAHMRYASTGTAASTGSVDDAVNAVGGQIYESQATKTLSTTAPNMVCGGFVTTTSDALIIVEGIIVTTTSAGALALWHSSEVAGQTSRVEVGSSGYVMKMA